MNCKSIISCLAFLFIGISAMTAQRFEPQIVDVVWLKGGSKLSGTILKWELARGMEFKLLTGAEIIIPKDDIVRVYQDIPFAAQSDADFRSFVREVKPYKFREKGMYHTFSGFLNLSSIGGVGLHYSAGHRFSRLLSVGLGLGYESHDLTNTRNLIPLYAEVRGFLLPKKITPYYALKMGYGFALKDEASGTIDARGGFHFSPEVGVRFGSGMVNYYLGVEYKLQNAQFTNTIWWDGSATFTDKVSYRRFELRSGLLF